MALPALLKVLGSGVASLAGGIIGLKGQQDANRNNERIMQQQNAVAERFWQKNNDYNTPSEQRKRYEEAGINPALALSQINSGIAQSVSPAASATYGNEAYSLGASIPSAFGAAFGAYQQHQQSRLIDAQIDKLEQETRLTAADADSRAETNSVAIEGARADISLKAQQAALAKVNAALSSGQLWQIKQMTPAQLAALDAKIESDLSSASWTRMRERLDKFQLENIAPEQAKVLKSELMKAMASIRLMSSQTSLNARQAELIGQKVFTEVAQRVGMSYDNALKSAQTERIGSLLGSELREIQSRIGVNKAKADREELGKYLDVVDAALDVGTAIYTGGLSKVAKDAAEAGVQQTRANTQRTNAQTSLTRQQEVESGYRSDEIQERTYDRVRARKYK